jgi:hypothetical protein
MKFPNKSYLAVLLKMWCDIGHCEKSTLQDTGRFIAEHKDVTAELMYLWPHLPSQTHHLCEQLQVMTCS